MCIKKIISQLNKLSDYERNRLDIILLIQKEKHNCKTIKEIASLTGWSTPTVSKYTEGIPLLLCQCRKRGCPEEYIEPIRTLIEQGFNCREIIGKLREEHGFTRSDSCGNHYVQWVAKEYEYTLSKGNNRTKSQKAKYDIVTRTAIFQHIWMGTPLSSEHKEYLWEQYPVLPKLEKWVKEFAMIFKKKNCALLYQFLEISKTSDIQEIVSFAEGLEKDLEAIENAVSSDLSNGVVEGKNNKTKAEKRIMYGACSLILLKAKIMYKPPCAIQ